MNHIISVVMRMTVFAVVLLGLFFFMWRCLLSIARDLVAGDHDQRPTLLDCDSRTSGSTVPQARLQLERR
jgi:hypothetical protein